MQIHNLLNKKELKIEGGNSDAAFMMGNSLSLSPKSTHALMHWFWKVTTDLLRLILLPIIFLPSGNIGFIIISFSFYLSIETPERIIRFRLSPQGLCSHTSSVK